VKFRHHAALTVAGIIAFIATIPLVAASWFLAPLMLVPLGIAAWAWRSGTDATRDGLRVRALLGQRRLRWTEIAEIGPVGGDRVVARLTDGSAVLLPAVRGRDLPRLAAALDAAPAASTAPGQPAD